MNQMLAVNFASPLSTRQRVHIKVTTLLGTRRFLALPPRVQNAIVPRTVILLGALSIGCSVTGSGLIQEKEQQVDAFDTISLGDGFSGTVVIGDQYGLSVRADDNLMAYVRIEQSGSQISVHLDNMTHRKSTLEAVFTMPRLAALSLRGGSHFDARDLVFANHLTLEAFGNSELTVYGRPDNQVTELSLTNSGGSTCSVTVAAEESLIEVSGGGRTRLQGEGRRMSMYLDGSSHLDAGRFPIDDLSFRLSGDSTATVLVLERASGKASGNSTLAVTGECKINAESSGSSSIERM